MKRIGLLGGMSAESTLLYYQTLIDLTRDRLGGLNSSDLLIRSVNFAPIAKAQADGDWASLGRQLNEEARRLEEAGADMLLLATNTMHKLADEMMHGLSIPLVHIADTTAAAVQAAGYSVPGLMATAFTMEQSFYVDRLSAVGLTPMVPNEEDRRETHRIIYEELCKGTLRDESRRVYEQIAQRLQQAGADSLILGCTEVGLLLSDDNCPVKTFDSARLHCVAAIDLALS